MWYRQLHCVRWIVIGLCTLLQTVYCQEEVGDSCIIACNGARGQCQLIKNCPSAIRNLQRVNPTTIQRCGFAGTQPIVCCTDDIPLCSSSSSTTIRTVTRRIRTRTTPRNVPPTVASSTVAPPITPTPLLLVGDKSRAKCKEYGEYIYEYAATGGAPTARCAIADVQLIVGGTLAKPLEFPHQALIGFDGEENVKVWQCGGTLISDQFVLTAAHCLFDQEYGHAKYLRIGDLNISSTKDDAEPQEFDVIRSYRNPEYKPPGQYNDIALLQMNRKARLNPYVRPACLYVAREIDFNRRPTATGWGKVDFSGDASTSLLKVTLDFFTHSDCNSSYRNNIGMRLRNGIMDQTQLCAGSRNESRDTCQGDSGGPLQMVNRDVHCTYSIVGVTSFGKACGIINIPGIYTRVSEYIEWIETIVWP